MDLRLPMHHAKGYTSASQIARRVTESWGEENLYCCACTKDELTANPANTHVADYFCASCAEKYQLKGQRRWGESVLGSNYQKMMDAIRQDRTPNFFLLRYEVPIWEVRDLQLIPRFAISPSVIARRKPLAPSARRPNWVGYTLRIALVPTAAKIDLIINGAEVDRREVRAKYEQITRLASLPPESRGWTLDVLRVIENLPARAFSNQEIYSFEFELAKLHPGNRNIRPKIRQQLQVLRDRGLIKQDKPGWWYRVT